MLEGRLVRLRALERSDVERAYTWVNDREVTQYLLLRYPMSRTQEEKYLAEAAEQGNGYADTRLAIETKDGLHIGMCGLHHGSAEDRHASLGIMVGDKSYWSNGYGSDAVMTLLRFAFEEMNLNKVELGVFAFNERAIACYQKCGFIEDGRRREHYFQSGRYCDIIEMSVLRREYEALQQNQAAAAAVNRGA